MPDEEETRLLAALVECHRVSLAARSALRHPVIYGGEDYRKLVEANATANVAYGAAEVALRAHRTKHKLI